MKGFNFLKGFNSTKTYIRHIEVDSCQRICQFSRSISSPGLEIFIYRHFTGSQFPPTTKSQFFSFKIPNSKFQIPTTKSQFFSFQILVSALIGARAREEDKAPWKIAIVMGEIVMGWNCNGGNCNGGNYGQILVFVFYVFKMRMSLSFFLLE